MKLFVQMVWRSVAEGKLYETLARAEVPFFQEAPLYDCSRSYAALNSLVLKFQSYLKILAHWQSIPRPRILMSTISLPQHPNQMIPIGFSLGLSDSFASTSDIFQINLHSPDFRSQEPCQSESEALVHLDCSNRNL